MQIRKRSNTYRPAEEFEEPRKTAFVGKSNVSPVRVYVNQHVIECMFCHGLEHKDIEVGGYLYGHSYVSDARAIVEITGIYSIKSPDSTSVHFRFCVEDSCNAERFQQMYFPEKEIIGWYHTHPGHGIFMSSVDINTHQKFFAPFHRVAFVVDPINRKFGAFAKEDGSVSALSGIHIVGESVPYFESTNDVVEFLSTELPPQPQNRNRRAIRPRRSFLLVAICSLAVLQLWIAFLLLEATKLIREIHIKQVP